MGIRCTPPLKHLLIAGMALALAALCYADPSGDPGSSTDAGPTTRPSHYGNGDGGAGLGGGLGGPGLGGAGLGGGGGGLFGDGRQRPGGVGGPGGRRFEGYTPEEAAAAIDFFNKNSPNRMAYFNRLPQDGPARRYETNMLVQTYRPLQNFKDTNPDLYKLLVQQVALRDDAFELAKDGKDAELLAKAGEIVAVSFKARSMRLDLLQKELDDQKSKLAEDKGNPDSAAEKELSRIKAEEDRLVRRAERHQGQFRQSMIDFDPTIDPLADVAPILGELGPEGS